MVPSNNKKILQQQVIRLTNEIEELRLEREESKKNVVFFIQEADLLRQELLALQQLSNTSPKLSSLLPRLNSLDEEKLNLIFIMLENPNMPHELAKLQSDHVSLEIELNQTRNEYHATRAALLIENERADIIEKRWKEAENSLEEAESTIQSLNQLIAVRNETMGMTTSKNHALLCNESKGENQKLQVKLGQLEQSVLHWQEKCEKMNRENVALNEEKTRAKLKEHHLKTNNKTLQEEIRKLSKTEQDWVNIEYLRNVILKFLERKNTRAQLVPILSTLLRCSSEDQTRLFQLTRNTLTS
ncbi:uncharacterized protein B0P05DRAFT_524699 [Gilbertella persicaria]|uniref:uncharacterized protein n=1 Tax=Gilbertella persicaria TaxID=101096 RepID=UPI00221E7E8B|nr:uncharacterized protein B0P05DRAFT_524699 [Gilbertella persicaria]KAI8095102.1 hypothetical protein B0P05DRAFT_524699 [Gilbertella persicaria]